MSDKKKKKKKGIVSHNITRLQLAHMYNECEPTVFKGGIARLQKIWNEMRTINTGAYGSGHLIAPIEGWGGSGDVDKYPVTACSPFTANVVAILFDPEGTATKKAYPKYTTKEGPQPLPAAFCALHNGNYKEKKKGKLPQGMKVGPVNHSAESIIYFNLGYEIQPKDLRRGDMVGIDWANGHGHATFIWDVHMATPAEGAGPDAYNEVDMFCYLSANGMAKEDPANPDENICYGPGVSIAGCDDSKYLSGANKFWKQGAGDKRGVKVAPVGGKDPLFADRPEHVSDAQWHCIPGKSISDIDRKTWAGVPEKAKLKLVDAKVRSLRCVRFWGFAPPKRSGETPYEQTQFQLAATLQYEEQPKSYATGDPGTPPPTYENVPITSVKGDVEKAKDSPPKKAEQPKQKEKFTAQQMWVEDTIGKLFDHGWLDTDPGDRDNPNDAESKAAIKEFQDKFKLSPADGQIRPNVIEKLKEAIRDCEQHKPNPNAPKPPEAKTSLQRVVWLRNRARPGSEMYFALYGNVSKIEQLTIKLTCRKTKKTSTLHAKIELDGSKVISNPIGLPDVFEDGCELLASFSGKGKDGVDVKYDSKSPLYIGPPMIAFALE